MQTLLIATTNPGKLAEIKKYLSGLPFTLVGLRDVGITSQPHESGATFDENAVLKAKYYADLSRLPTLADDGGFEIDALGGEPGVKSHRWVHSDRDSEDEELIAYTFKKTEHVSKGKRGAQLRVVLAFVMPGEKAHTAEASVRGIIPDKPSERRTKGFPYRSILYLPEIHKYYDEDELTDDEAVRFNHRRKALMKLAPVITRLLTGAS